MPGEDPVLKEMDNTLEALQAAVGGHIEHIGLGRFVGGQDESHLRVGILVDEDGLAKGLDPNFMLFGDVILGPALFVGEDEEDFTGLTEEQSKEIIMRFSQTE